MVSKGQWESNSWSLNLRVGDRLKMASILGAGPFSSFPHNGSDSCDGFGDLGEFLRIISILHNYYILKIHHTCFIWSSRFLKTFCRVNNILDVGCSKHLNLVSNGNLPEIMVLKGPWTSNSKLCNSFAGHFLPFATRICHHWQALVTRHEFSKC